MAFLMLQRGGGHAMVWVYKKEVTSAGWVTLLYRYISLHGCESAKELCLSTSQRANQPSSKSPLHSTPLYCSRSPTASNNLPTHLHSIEPHSALPPWHWQPAVDSQRPVLPSPSPLFILIFVCINTVITHGVRLASISTPHSAESTAYVAPLQVPTYSYSYFQYPPSIYATLFATRATILAWRPKSNNRISIRRRQLCIYNGPAALGSPDPKFEKSCRTNRRFEGPQK